MNWMTPRAIFATTDQGLVIGVHAARRLTGPARGTGLVFADELALEERAFWSWRDSKYR